MTERLQASNCKNMLEQPVRIPGCKGIPDSYLQQGHGVTHCTQCPSVEAIQETLDNGRLSRKLKHMKEQHSGHSVSFNYWFCQKIKSSFHLIIHCKYKFFHA